jgi:hypothetical protein
LCDQRAFTHIPLGVFRYVVGASEPRAAIPPWSTASNACSQLTSAPSAEPSGSTQPLLIHLTVFVSVKVSDNWSGGLPPSIPTDTAIVYDVTTDVSASFILESRKDPTFRVQLQVVLRG